MIDLSDIQSIVPGPNRASEMELRFLRFESTKAMAEFLRAAADAVTVAEPDPWLASPTHAINVGLTGAGLRFAEVPTRAYDALPLAFTAGMRAAANRLGDQQASDPANWDFPFRLADPDVHAVVIGFDGAPIDPIANLAAPQPGPEPAPKPVWCAERRPGDVEAFGFRDGISDPVIDGSGRRVTPGNGVWDAEKGAWREVRPGEAILGYVDESGMVAGHPDAAQIERNGSYLVVRRLEQDVDGFERETRAWSDRLGGSLSADDIAARMVGRHRDGTVLGGSVDEPQNDFLYRDGGKPGIHVSPTAHIRRANPRDGIASAADIVPRHLLFRRGLPYREGDEGGVEREGLLFLACCADLRRQFEFVQSNWLQDGLRFGLGHESDPLLGQRTKVTEGTDPQDPPVVEDDQVSIRGRDGDRLRRPMSSFVTTRGGEYFLIPAKSALAYLVGHLDAVNETKP